MNYQTVRWVIIGLLVIVGAYLVIDHGQHITPYFPFVFLLGCLFMHIFGHGGHGTHDHQTHDEHTKKDS